MSNCKLAATQELQLDFTNAISPQLEINAVFPTLCIPECGNVILDVYDDCRAFDFAFPGTKEFTAGLCSTNENQDNCYSVYGNAFNLIQTEISCYRNYKSDGQCSCQSQLSEGVSEQGCCLNIYHDFISGLPGVIYSSRELYNACNVDRPADCNNSPISGSISLASTITLILSLIYFAVLG